MHSIVYDHQTFSLQAYGGISRYFCELALRLNRADGFRARVLAPVHFNRHLSDCAAPKLGLYLPKLWKTGPLYRAVNRAVSPRLSAMREASLVHRTFFEPIAKPAGVPVVVTVFDMINELFPETFPAADTTALQKRDALALADHVVCISQSTADDLARVLGIAGNKVSITHLSCSEVFAAPPPEGESSPHARPYLLFVGHRAGHKNFDSLLAAYAASSHLRAEFNLVAFGGLPFSDAERDRFTSLGLQGQVARWSGPDEALARAYRHARAFVYPSSYEGFGIPPLEAMSAGCVVACSNTSSIPEVVGHAARLFDPGDLHSMREAIEAVALDDGLRVSLRAAGRARAQLFSWDRCAEQTLAAYRLLLG